MYSTTVYLYQQITKVLLVDTSGGYFTMRYNPVYAKQLTVNKGVDNVLLFEFINQDQKPVNITGSTFIFRLINQEGDQIFVQKQMEVLAANVGRVKVVLTPEETDLITAQPASYSIQVTNGNYVQAVYVNDNSNARGDCNIVDSILPQFIPSAELTLPDMYGKNSWSQVGPTSWPDWALQPQPLNFYETTEFYSSFIPTTGQNLTTIKMDLVHYTGTIKVEGAANYESVWYNATDSYEYFDVSETIYFNVLGYHPLLRVALNTSVGYGASGNAVVSDGVITGVSLTNPGANYVAAPYVQILGNGAGAEVVANFTPGGNGGIAGFTVINGGSGYLPLQFGSTQCATVLVTNGLVRNLQYR